MSLTTNALLDFVSRLEGEQIPTLAGRAAFSVRRMPESIEITPASTGKPRQVTREMLQRVLDEYDDTRSLSPGRYQAITFDASYLLAIIDRFNRHRELAR